MKTTFALLVTFFSITSVSSQTSDYFTDPRDGQIYRTFTIEHSLLGTTTWMAENFTENNLKSMTGWVKNGDGNSSMFGFNAYPGGWAISNNTEFGGIGEVGGFCSSTTRSPSNLFARLFLLKNEYTHGQIPYIKKTAGYSVRCVKND